MKSKFDLTSKVVVVTGGSGLLGEAFVIEIIETGGFAVIGEVELAKAQETEKKILANFPAASLMPVCLDITNKESVNKAISLVDSRLGRIDALVNNAYPRNEHYGRMFYDVEYEDFCENVAMNLGGYFLTSQCFAKYFIKQGYGNILNIASIYGVSAPKFELYEDTTMTMPVEYAAIKAGLIHLTKYMAKYLKGKNIRINALSPGGIIDGQDIRFIERYKSYCASKGLLDGKDILGALVFLLSDASTYINGQNLIVDDGFIL